MRQGASETDLAADLHIPHHGHVLDPVLDRHGLAVTRHVDEGDGARFQIGGVPGVDHRSVVADDAHARQAHSSAVDGLAVADRGRDLAGVAHHGEAARAKDRHAPIAGQAHRIDAKQISVQRQIAVGHSAVAHAGCSHWLGSEDLAVRAHPVGGVPRLALVPSRRDHRSEANAYQTGLVVDTAADAGRLDLAVNPCRHVLRATNCAGVLDRQRPRTKRCRASAEHKLAGDVLADRGHATGALNRVVRARRPGRQRHVPGQVVDRAARDPATGGELAQGALAVVAPRLRATDGEKHRARHHLGIHPRHQLEGREERMSLGLVAGRARAVVAELHVAGLIVGVQRRCIDILDARIVQPPASRTVDAGGGVDRARDADVDVRVEQHLPSGVVHRTDSGAVEDDIATAIISGDLDRVHTDSDAHFADLSQRVGAQHRLIGQGVPLHLQRARFDRPQGGRHRYLPRAIA